MRGLSFHCRFPQIYKDFHRTIELADYQKDLKWWSNNHGVDMAMNWPAFEVSLIWPLQFNECCLHRTLMTCWIISLLHFLRKISIVYVVLYFCCVHCHYILEFSKCLHLYCIWYYLQSAFRFLKAYLKKPNCSLCCLWY